MIHRHISQTIQDSARHFKVVSILGPRQSGKTTLCKKLFSHKPYLSLEPLDTRMYAQDDPRGFLSQFPDGAVLDEVQHVPELFSYIQDMVDQKEEKGVFILTGSQNFTLSEKISQSLAGRTSIKILMPLSFQEIKGTSFASSSVWETIWKGGYPELNTTNISTHEWMQSYIQTYLEKDVRQILNIGDIRSFSLFLSLLASHTSQEVNYHKISLDIGVSHNTVKRWVSILEQSFLIHFLPAWHVNTRKQILKKTKLHFSDTGIVCALLNISSPDQLRLHPLRGAIFETWVASELYKSHLSSGAIPKLFHYRENSGIEFDCIDTTHTPILYEIKSGQTMHSHFLKNFSVLNARKENIFKGFEQKVIYGGEASQSRGEIEILSWESFTKTASIL